MNKDVMLHDSVISSAHGDQYSALPGRGAWTAGPAEPGGVWRAGGA